ncbi:MAG: 8-amino-7-oxononanoate synthase [Candidatus Omnitrophica bacterium]|nr:8-amino-7-oxononanoate synthase [Candidatus Omnitrophota bacterium]
MERLRDFLIHKKQEGLLRTLRPISARQGTKIRLGGKDYIDFSSNDYLGLSGHPRLIEASNKTAQEFGTASSASRLLSGDLQIHHQLEEAVARLKNKESALVFNSGYQANIGIISTLFNKGDCIFSDRLNHASIIDGIMLSGARFLRFKHNDMEQLEVLLKRERARFKRALIVTETVFSMDGDRCPLKELVVLKEKYNCQLMVDEAHATGIFGQRGSGMVEEEGVSEQVDIIMGTFSKAMAGFGAYVAASKEIIEYLINTSRAFIYSTALPPAVIACDIAALALVKEEPLRRKSLLESARYFRQGLRDKGFQVKGDSQIVPLIIGDNLKAVEAAQKLQEKGFWVLPIRPPTVPQGQARLRFSLSYDHDKEVLDRLIQVIAESVTCS